MIPTTVFGLFLTFAPLVIQPGMSLEQAVAILRLDPRNSLPTGGLVGGTLFFTYKGSGITVFYEDGKVHSVEHHRKDP
jgi:hypothetical protein